MTDTVRLPREPTAEMLDADVPVRAMEPLELEELQQGKPLRAIRRSVWRAMIAAAPQATDPRGAEIERLTRERDEAIANWLEVRGFCRNHGTMRRRAEYSLAAAEARLATLSAERDELKRLWQDTETPYDRLQQIKLLIAERDALLDDCRTLLTTIFKHVDPDALPNYGEVLAISSRVPPLTAPQPGGTETPDA